MKTVRSPPIKTLKICVTTLPGHKNPHRRVFAFNGTVPTTATATRFPQPPPPPPPISKPVTYMGRFQNNPCATASQGVSGGRPVYQQVSHFAPMHPRGHIAPVRFSPASYRPMPVRPPSRAMIFSTPTSAKQSLPHPTSLRRPSASSGHTAMEISAPMHFLTPQTGRLPFALAPTVAPATPNYREQLPPPESVPGWAPKSARNCISSDPNTPLKDMTVQQSPLPAPAFMSRGPTSSATTNQQGSQSFSPTKNPVTLPTLNFSPTKFHSRSPTPSTIAQQQNSIPIPPRVNNTVTPTIPMTPRSATPSHFSVPPTATPQTSSPLPVQPAATSPRFSVPPTATPPRFSVPPPATPPQFSVPPPGTPPQFSVPPPATPPQLPVPPTATLQRFPVPRTATPSQLTVPPAATPLELHGPKIKMEMKVEPTVEMWQSPVKRNLQTANLLAHTTLVLVADLPQNSEEKSAQRLLQGFGQGAVVKNSTCDGKLLISFCSKDVASTFITKFSGFCVEGIPIQASLF